MNKHKSEQKISTNLKNNKYKKSETQQNYSVNKSVFVFLNKGGGEKDIYLLN